MGAAAEAVRSREAVVSVFGFSFHVAFLIQVLSAILVIILWTIHSHYVGFLKMAVDRQREIEQGLLIEGKEVLQLGRDITRKRLRWYLRNPWNYLFLALTIWALVLSVAYLQISVN